MADYVAIATLPREGPGGWHYAVQDEPHGPFTTFELALADRQRVLQRWNARARALGGWTWVQTAERWGVVLPADVPCPLPRLQSAPCTRHGPS